MLLEIKLYLWRIMSCDKSTKWKLTDFSQKKSTCININTCKLEFSETRTNWKHLQIFQMKKYKG